MIKDVRLRMSASNETGQLTEGNFSLLQQACARPEHQHDRPEKGENDEGNEGRPEPGSTQCDVEKSLQTRPVTCQLRRA
jgi:hypothetical protein